MNKVAEDIWVVEGEVVSFCKMPYATRMTIVRLQNGELFIHSPIRLSRELQLKLLELGEVKYLIAPNHLHHLFISDWLDAYPEAQSYGTQEVINKRKDLRFNGSFNLNRKWPWEAELSQELFTGSFSMQECVFFHPASKVLILTDLIENFSGQEFNWWQKLVAQFIGILAPNGKTPLDWRLTFMFNKETARQHAQKIMAWQPDIVIMSHGMIVTDNAGGFLARAFNWLR
ncbi:DUF4336 domain-containing protein (plasmid) [Pseudoalteromonas sp. T1lg65]|uniref:DUF4336 domain-containing protein n=1 Tax=Pseudoalteromonas sp. T1lg65 TaxID=2077101 RepID=UPI003F7A10BD